MCVWSKFVCVCTFNGYAFTQMYDECETLTLTHTHIAHQTANIPGKFTSAKSERKRTKKKLDHFAKSYISFHIRRGIHRHTRIHTRHIQTRIHTLHTCTLASERLAILWHLPYNFHSLLIKIAFWWNSYCRFFHVPHSNPCALSNGFIYDIAERLIKNIAFRSFFFFFVLSPFRPHLLTHLIPIMGEYLISTHRSISNRLWIVEGSFSFGYCTWSFVISVLLATCAHILGKASF